MEKIYVTSEASQVDLVTNRILWECLQVIKTEPEFKDLSYRASLGLNNQEILTVYRDKMIGIFALPIEPISLTVEPNGKCLLVIPFKPVLRVTITNSSTCEVDRGSFMDLLRLVSGKGYTFCPGLPAKILIGKACGKYVVIHRIPFKRYSAQGCPVYFQSQGNKTLLNKSNLQALCPRCLQVLRWVQTLPVIRKPTPSTGLQSYAVIKAPLADATKQQNARNFSPMDTTSSNDCVIVSVEDAEVRSLAPLACRSSTPASPAPSVGQSLKIQMNSSPVIETPGKGPRDVKSNDVNVKLQSALRQLLQARTNSKPANSLPIDGTSNYPINGDTDQTERNICKLCQKQFSSNLRLSRHVQRHEGLLRHLKPLQGRKSSSVVSSDVILRRVFRGYRFMAKNGKKSHRDISPTSFRLLWKCIANVVGEGMAEQSKQSKDPGRKRKRESDSPRDDSSSSEKGKTVKMNTKVSKASSDTLESEKSEMGLSALLVAADLANNQSLNESETSAVPYSSSMSLPFTMDTNVRHNESSTTNADLSGISKNARKSLRLATKRAKIPVKKMTSSNKILSETGTIHHHHSSDDSLTNLDLLSTVSLQAAPVAVLKPMLLNSTGRIGPMARTSQPSRLPFSISPSVSNVSLPQTRKSMPVKPVPSMPPALIQIAPGDSCYSNIPSLPLLAFINQDHHSPAADSRTPHPPFDPETSSPVTSLPTNKKRPVVRNHNIPLSVLDIDLSPSGSAFKTLVTGSPEQLSSSKFNCGAMDLSKRKLPSCNVMGISAQVNLPLAAESSKMEADVIRRLLMPNPNLPKDPVAASVSRDLPSPRSLTSNKEADENLQARIFASAKNYKTDSVNLSSGQVQTVVAPLPGLPSNLQNKPFPSEIQCGYKWSGSGGLVKERTQMVRELVPTDFIFDLFNKTRNDLSQKEEPSISATVTGVAKVKSPFGSSSFSRLYQAPGKVSTSLPSTKKMKNPVEIPPQKPTVPFALNLSKSRPDSEAHGRLTVLPSTLLSSALPTTLGAFRSQMVHASTVCSGPLASVLRNSTGQSHILAEQLPTSLSQSKYNTIGSMAKSISFPASITSVSPLSSTSASHSISSPSLAAILRQPPNPRIAQNDGILNAQSPPALARSPDQELICVKQEPVDSELDNSNSKESTADNLPYVVIKSETPASIRGIHRSEYESSSTSSLLSVVVNMSSDKFAISSFASDSNPVSRTSNLNIKSTVAVKCEYCFKPLSSTDFSNHVCACPNT